MRKTSGIPDTAGDFEHQAVAAYLAGRDDDSAHAWEQAHLECQRLDDPERAARCAFWLGFGLSLRGEMARANGWFARAGRLVGDQRDSAARGLLLVPAAVTALESGENELAHSISMEATEIAQRSGDPDVLAFALLVRGEALLALGDTARGLAALDEVMVAITTGEVSTVATGIVYCAVIGACMDVFDWRRAAEWTDVLSGWCDAQPGLVPFRGQCLVHRSQVLQARGEWPQAALEAARACERLAQPRHPALGVACYQQAELHRLCGEFDLADQAYREASSWGREPVPGLALLRLAEGNIEGAAAAIRGALDEAHGLERPIVLAAGVEILLAARDVAAARAASDELSETARDIGASVLDALAAHAAGAVRLAEGDSTGALTALRRASSVWRALDMPYDAARARELIARARQAAGDHETADLELDGARATFARLGARPDLTRLAARAGMRGPEPSRTLTERECEVLRLVAQGKTNRDIGAALVISEHTVARHLQNVFAKLGLSSRTAATAYAYEHGVL